MTSKDIPLPDDHADAVVMLPPHQLPYGANAKFDRRVQSVFHHYNAAKAEVLKFVDFVGLSLMEVRLADPDRSEGREIFNDAIKDIQSKMEIVKIRLSVRRLCREHPLAAMSKKHSSDSSGKSSSSSSSKTTPPSGTSTVDASSSGSSKRDGSSSSSKAAASSLSSPSDSVANSSSSGSSVSAPKSSKGSSSAAVGAVKSKTRALHKETDLEDISATSSDSDDDDSSDGDDKDDKDVVPSKRARRGEKKCLNQLFSVVADDVSF